MDIKNTIQTLREELNQHNYNYYVLDTPTISDFEFDLKLKQPQWVSCSEGLPLEQGVYIVSCASKNGYGFVSGDYFYISDNTEGGFFDAFGTDVIAWQPLPKPYMEETK